jgi:hypothetical protein
MHVGSVTRSVTEIQGCINDIFEGILMLFNALYIVSVFVKFDFSQT